MQRVKPLPGDPRGPAPLASLAETEKPHGFFDEAVHGGLPQCETCLTTRSRLAGYGGRRRGVSGFVICLEERCLMSEGRAKISVPKGNDILLDDPSNEGAA